MASTDGSEKQIVAKGTVIIAYILNNEPVLEINDKKLGSKLTNRLQFITTFSLGVSDDSLFGTTEKKMIGDKWNISIDSFLEEYRRSNIKIEGKDVDGTSQIKNLVKFDEQPCLTVKSDIFVKKFSLPLQEGSELHGSGLKIKYMTLQPVNLNMHLPKTSFEADQFYRTITRKTPDDTGLIMDWHLNVKVDNFMRLVK